MFAFADASRSSDAVPGSGEAVIMADCEWCAREGQESGLKQNFTPHFYFGLWYD